MMVILFKKVFENPFTQIISTIFIVMLLSGWLISQFEIAPNGEDGLSEGMNPFWWAIVTMTTVGYGDFAPKTFEGRILAIIIMFAGISLTALLTATVSSIFVARRIREDKGLEILKISDHIVICGWNSLVDNIIDSLQNMHENKKLNIVLINNQNDETISTFRNSHKGINFKFVKGDFTREPILDKANVKKAKTVIILPSDYLTSSTGHPDEKTIFATLTIKTSAPNCRVIAFIVDRENLTHIKRANADEIILSDDFSSYMVASSVNEPGVSRTVENLMSLKTKSIFKQLDIPDGFIGKTYDSLFNYFKKMGLILISVYSEDEKIGIGEILSSDTSALDHFIERKLKDAGHSLTEENKMNVIVNPKDEYIIKENEKAIVIK